MSYWDAIWITLFAGLAVLALPYCVLGSAYLDCWLAERSQPTDAPVPPLTFLRPLKRGVPALREKLESLVLATGAQDQIVIGVDDGSEEAVLADEVRARFPERDIVVVACASKERGHPAPDPPIAQSAILPGPCAEKFALRGVWSGAGRPRSLIALRAAGAALNPKISKLVQMEAHARHEHWLLSDSEAMLDAEFLAAFRDEWAASGADVLTAGYRFRNLRTWPQRLDAAAVLLTLWPGLAMVRRHGTVRFTLGACTALRRSDVAAVGGWKAFGADLAEDNRLGAALAAAGKTIRLSAHVATLDSDPLSWRGYWRHQRRVAVTYRASNPAGFAGMIFTQTWPWCALIAVIGPADGLGPRAALGLLIFILALRAQFAWETARVLDFRVPWLPLLVPIATLVESVCWFASWGSRSVWWGGRKRRVSFRGGLMPHRTPEG